MVKFTKVKSYDFNGKNIMVFMDEESILWFYGNQIAEVLEYSNLNSTINKKVEDEFKTKFSRRSFLEMLNCRDLSKMDKSYGIKDLINEEKDDIISNIWENENDLKHKVFINEPGFYKLCFSSKMKEATNFTNWVVKRSTSNYQNDW